MTTVVSGILSWPGLLLQLVANPVFSVLAIVTFGVAAYPLYVLNVLFKFITVGTSRLWLNYPPIRVPLLIPGAVFASLHATYVPFVLHFGDWEGRAREIALPNSWPRSSYVARIPAYRELANSAWEALKTKYGDGRFGEDEFLRGANEIRMGILEVSPTMSNHVWDEMSQLVDDAAEKMSKLLARLIVPESFRR